MQETIDLIARRDLRVLERFTRETGQPTDATLLDTEPMEHVTNIDIDEEHITITFNERQKYNYNTTEVTHKEWSYKYNDDPEFVRAVAAVIELSRRHVKDLPENVACPPGCAECCAGYEPYVNKADVARIAQHLSMTYDEVMREYVNKRESADGFNVGWLKKVGDEITDKCVFLKGTRSGRYYCGIYEARPHDCGLFTPIGCDDVDSNLPYDGKHVVGTPFVPRHPKRSTAKKRRRS
jgi:Fe-S-cluster containining protein